MFLPPPHRFATPQLRTLFFSAPSSELADGLSKAGHALRGHFFRPRYPLRLPTRPVPDAGALFDTPWPGEGILKLSSYKLFSSSCLPSRSARHCEACSLYPSRTPERAFFFFLPLNRVLPQTLAARVDGPPRALEQERRASFVNAFLIPLPKVPVRQDARVLLRPLRQTFARPL